MITHTLAFEDINIDNHSLGNVQLLDEHVLLRLSENPVVAQQEHAAK